MKNTDKEFIEFIELLKGGTTINTILTEADPYTLNEVLNDQHLYKLSVCIKPIFILVAPKLFKLNTEYLIDILKLNWNVIKFIPMKYRRNKHFMLQAITIDTGCFFHASRTLVDKVFKYKDPINYTEQELTRKEILEILQALINQDKLKRKKKFLDEKLPINSLNKKPVFKI